MDVLSQSITNHNDSHIKPQGFFSAIRNYILKKLLVACFIVVIGGLFLPGSSSANVSGSGSHKTYVEFFRTTDSALAACQAFAASFGSSTNCSSWGGVTVQGGHYKDACAPGCYPYNFHFADYRIVGEEPSSAGDDNFCPETGNPVNCLTGAKIQKTNVFESSGTDTLGLSTTYNSHPQIIESGATITIPKGSFGALRDVAHVRYVKKIQSLYSGYDHSVLIAKERGFSKMYHGTGRLTSGDVVLTAVDRSEATFTMKTDGTFVELMSDGTQYIYNANEQLTKKLTPEGKETNLSYYTTGNGSGEVSTITNHFGHQITFTYNALGFVSEVIDPDSRSYLFEYDANDNLIKITFPDDTPADSLDNHTKQFLFEDTNFPHALTGIIDENDVRYATWAYDTNGRAVLSEHINSADKVEIDYSVADQTTVKAYVDGTNYREITYKFAYFGGLKRIHELVTRACTGCPPIKTETQEFTEYGELAAYVDAEGNRTEYDIDTSGLEQNRIEAVGSIEERSIATEWDTILRFPIKETTSLLETTYGYNANSNLVNTTQKDLATNQTRSVTRTYNSDGQVLTVDGPRTDVSDITTFTYHSCTTGSECGQTHTVTNALGHVVTYSQYNAMGQPTQISDANGIQTVLTYDARHRLISSAVDGTYTTQLDYDAIGQVTRITAPNGNFIDYEYDDARRLKAIEDALGNRIEYTLDSVGNRKKVDVKDDAGVLLKTQTNIFDELSRTLQNLGANGQDTTYTYDGNDNRLTSTDIGKPTATSQFDALNRLIEITDAASGVTKYSYDDEDRIKTVTDPDNLITTYNYNGFGDLVSINSPDTGLTSFTIDEAGNTLTKTDARGKVTTNAYDALNRIKTENYADSSLNITYSYDDITNGNKGKGRLTSVIDSSGTSSYIYDARGLITSIVKTTGPGNQTTAYAYDNSGLITGITYPSGRVIGYLYDVTNRITTITSTKGGNTATLTSNISYRPFGPATSMTFGNGLANTLNYDLDYRLNSLVNGSVVNRNYGYDTNNNVTAITDNLQPSNSHTYDYDNLDRLTDGIGPDGDRDYAYDGTGNRTTLTLGGTAIDIYGYTANTHHLASISGANPDTYGYDAAGNRNSDNGGQRTFEYNDRGRLFKIFENGNLTATYTYNFLGQRTSKVTSAGTTNYHYSLKGQLISETDGTGATLREYIYRDTIPIAQIDIGTPDKTTYLHTDHLGTSRFGTNSSGTVVWSWLGESFGNTAANQDPDGDSADTIVNLRFAGQYLDDESGLFYNYFRYYDPEIGRYITSDPIGLAGGINTYGYVGGNPVIRFDSYGLDWEFDTNTGTLTETNADGNPTGTWPAGSGPWGNGELPPGGYTINGGPVPVPSTHPDQASYCDRAGNCWWLPIDPDFSTTRFGLGIHPDGNLPGTAGCIGATDDDTSDLFNALSNSSDPFLIVY